MNKLIRLLALVCAFSLCLCGCEVTVHSREKLDNPKKTLIVFVEAMKAHDFAAAEACVGNYSTMGFDGVEELFADPNHSIAAELLFDSFAVTFADGSMDDVPCDYESDCLSVTGKEGTMKFTFTYLDLSLLADAVEEYIVEIGREEMFSGESTLETEDQAMALFAEAVEKVTADGIEKCCVQRDFIIGIEYKDGGWKLMLTNEFYNALLGK